MPLIHVHTSAGNIQNQDSILKTLSLELSNLTKKPENYVMAILQTDLAMTFGGTNSPCCYIEVKSIGALNPSEMTKKLCTLIEDLLKIPQNRIYISFEDINGEDWGFNGNTFR